MQRHWSGHSWGLEVARSTHGCDGQVGCLLSLMQETPCGHRKELEALSELSCSSVSSIAWTSKHIHLVKL